jgi:hypothetical protein
MGYLIAILTLGCCLLLGLLVVETAWTDPTTLQGTVIDKFYSASSTSVGTGVAVGSNGRMVPVTTVESGPEKYTVIVQIGSEVVSAHSTPNRWAALNKGDQTGVIKLTGHLFGSTVGYHIQ